MTQKQQLADFDGRFHNFFKINHLKKVSEPLNGKWSFAMESEELKRRTKAFAHRGVKLAAALPDTALGSHVRGQLIRCATSVASNYRAACIAQSKASFVSKLSIVLEETDESYFWLEFIIDEKLLKRELVEPLSKEAEELTAIFVSSRRTARKTED